MTTQLYLIIVLVLCFISAFLNLENYNKTKNVIALLMGIVYLGIGVWTLTILL